jgi:hypothetical protein
MGSRKYCQTKPKYGLLQLPSVLDICASTGAPVSLRIVAGGYQADCYKVGGSCILASVLDKGKPAAR